MSRALLCIFLLAFTKTILEASPVGDARLVYPRLIEARAPGNQLMLFINENITLSLQPVDIFPDKFLLQFNDGKASVNQYIKGTELGKLVYHDKDQKSAVSLERDNGLHVNGIIRNSLRIRPATLMGRSIDELIAHEIFEVQESFPNTDHDVPVPGLPVKLLRQRYSQGKIPEKVHIEMAIIADTDKHKNYKKTMDVALYAAVLIAAVSIKYICHFILNVFKLIVYFSFISYMKFNNEFFLTPLYAYFC
ncbi:uncharacterized protein LOC115324591 [Ixodes scapularis]|uniref:uncharacterized protein LOC115324591 n=1 Tax=Ixodes scapularis TaxID=6945 RepID=UPI001C381A43|nr:uncharacterized protein LOC115324591 [Ixodes scapularis]